MKALGIGAVLWDCLTQSDGQEYMHIGGSVFNVMAHLAKLGNAACIYTALGHDTLGDEADDKIQSLQVDNSLLHRTDEPTCVVRVVFDEKHQPSYHQDFPVSWDAISIDVHGISAIKKRDFDCLCFGTLEQRSASSRHSIRQILATCPFETVYLDLSLRSPDYSREVIDYSLNHCTIAKMNLAEAWEANRLLGLNALSIEDCMRKIKHMYTLHSIVVTDGANGAYYLDRNQYGYCKGYSVNVVDTIGAGDAFSAGLLHQLAVGAPIDKACDFACRMGALICASQGAIPNWTTTQLEKITHK